MKWHQGSIPEAIAESKLRKALFLVFISSDNDQSQQINSSLEEAAVSNKLGPTCVAIKLEANSEAVKQFSQIYPVVVIPSTFFIGLNGIPLEVIIEPLSSTDLLEKVNKVLQLHEQQQLQDQVNVPLANATTPVASTSTLESTENSANMASTTLDNSQNAFPLDARVERAKKLAVDLRKQKQKEDEEKEKQKEVERRKMGKQMLLNKQKQQEQEVRQVAEDIAREKAEERAARERIREQIAQDRADRAAKFSVEKAEEERKKHEALQIKLRAEQERAAIEAANRSLFARLQFRLPDGSATNHQFDANATLQVVFDYVKETVKPPFSPFKLCLTFPRREFQTNDFSQTLRDLQLAPSSSVLVLPVRGTVIQSSGNNGLMGFLFMFMSPFLMIWRWLQSYWLPNKPKPAGNKPTSTSGRNNQGRGNNSSDNNSRNFGRQQGKIYRMSDPNGEDDDNNTWNGNSTQQM